MTTQKLDFEFAKARSDYACEPDKNWVWTIHKLKQLCQAVDAINERIGKLESMMPFNNNESKTECKHDLHPWNDYYKKCNNCDQLFHIDSKLSDHLFNFKSSLLSNKPPFP